MASGWRAGVEHRVIRSWLVPVAAILLLFLAGCDEEAPLSTEHVVPVDPAFLGAWEMVPETEEERAIGDSGALVVLRFSPTEYLVHDPGGSYYRAFLFDLGGHRCLQLEDLGSGSGPASGPQGYLVVRCDADGDDGFTVSLLNDKHFPAGGASTAELRAAFLAARDTPDLFEPIARFRRRLLPDLALPAPEPGAARDHVETAAFGPGGRRLVVGLRSGHVAALDLVDGRLAWSVAAHEQPVHSIAFGGTDRWLLTAADDLRATLRRGDTGGEYLSFEAAPLRKVYAIALSSDARYAVTRGFDGFGTVWDLRFNEQVCDLFSYGFAMGPRGRLVASTPGREPGMELRSITPGGRIGEPLRLLSDRMIRGVAIDPAGTTVAAAGTAADGRAAVWLLDPADGRIRGEIPLTGAADASEPTAAGDAAFSPDGRFLAASSSDGRIVRIDVADRTIVDTWRMPEGLQARAVGFAGADVWVTSDALAPADAGDDGTITRLQRPGEREPVWTAAGAAVVSADRPLAAVATQDGDLLLLGRTDGAAVRRLRPFANGRSWHVLP